MICVGYPSSFSAHLLVELIEAGQGLAAGRGGSAPHQNMRLIQSVVPGVHSPEFAAEARRQWRDDHLFTRFSRKLYFPQKPLAGDDAPRARDWKRFAG